MSWLDKIMDWMNGTDSEATGLLRNELETVRSIQVACTETVAKMGQSLKAHQSQIDKLQHRGKADRTEIQRLRERTARLCAERSQFELRVNLLEARLESVVKRLRFAGEAFEEPHERTHQSIKEEVEEPRGRDGGPGHHPTWPPPRPGNRNNER